MNSLCYIVLGCGDIARIICCSFACRLRRSKTHDGQHGRQPKPCSRIQGFNAHLLKGFQLIKATIHVACTLAACAATMRTPSITCLCIKVVLLWLHAVEFRPATKTIETSFYVQLVGTSARQSNQRLNSKAAAHLTMQK
jgi:hypothetical protein